MRNLTFIAVFALLAIAPITSNAGIVVTFTDVGNDLLVSFTGTATVNGLGTPGNFNASVSEINVSPGFSWVWSQLEPGDDIYTISSTFHWADGDINSTPGVGSADPFGFRTQQGSFLLLYFEDGFTQGSIDGSIRFDDLAVADLQINPGTVTWGPGSDQFITFVGPEAIPTPSAAASMLVLFIAAGMRRRPFRAQR